MRKLVDKLGKLAAEFIAAFLQRSFHMAFIVHKAFRIFFEDFVKSSGEAVRGLVTFLVGLYGIIWRLSRNAAQSHAGRYGVGRQFRASFGNHGSSWRIAVFQFLCHVFYGFIVLEGGKNLVALNMITSRIRHHIEHCNDEDDMLPIDPPDNE